MFRSHLVIKIILQFIHSKLWILWIHSNSKIKKLALSKRVFHDLWLVLSYSYAVSQSDRRCWCLQQRSGLELQLLGKDKPTSSAMHATLQRVNTLF